MKSRQCIGLILLALFLIVLPVEILSVRGSTGTLYVSPHTTGLLKPGASFNVSLKVSNIDPFAGWDISVKTNNTVITPVSLTISGNVLSTNTTAHVQELSNCVNGGVGIPGGSPGNETCTNTDGPGIAHSSIYVLGSFSETGPVNGLLFIITYKVTGIGNYSKISPIQDFISASNGRSVAQTPPTEGIYGSPPRLDFVFFPDQSSLSITQGQSANSTLTLTSINGLSGVANFSAALSVYGSPISESTAGINVSFIPSNVLLKPGQSNSSTLKISAKISTTALQYTVTVNATIGSLVHAVILTISVHNRGDFGIDASPGLLRVHATDKGATTITLQSNNGFSGNVTLRPTVIDYVTGNIAAGVDVSYNVTTLQLVAGGIAASALTVTTPPSNLPFKYIITTTATSEGLSRSIDVVVQPPSPEIGFDVTQRSLSAVAGSSEKLNVTLTSKDYFQGPVYLFATSFSGTKLSFTPSGVDFDLGNKTTTANIVLTITTDPTTALGLHFIVLTASSASLTRFSNVTLTVLASTSPVVKLAPRTILGVAPLVYFGILGALSVILLAATVLEARRRRQPSRLL